MARRGSRRSGSGGRAWTRPNGQLPRPHESVLQDSQRGYEAVYEAVNRAFLAGSSDPGLSKRKPGSMPAARAVYPKGDSSRARGMGRSPITAYHYSRLHGSVAQKAPVYAKQSSSSLNRLLSVSRVRVPFNALFCVKRRIRREVLHALGKVGFSGSSSGSRRKGGRRSYRRTVSSQFSC